MIWWLLVYQVVDPQRNFPSINMVELCEDHVEILVRTWQDPERSCQDLDKILKDHGKIPLNNGKFCKNKFNYLEIKSIRFWQEKNHNKIISWQDLVKIFQELCKILARCYDTSKINFIVKISGEESLQVMHFLSIGLIASYATKMRDMYKTDAKFEQSNTSTSIRHKRQCDVIWYKPSLEQKHKSNYSTTTNCVSYSTNTPYA